MKHALIIVSLLLIFAGIAVLCVAIANGGTFYEKYESVTHDIEGSFDKIIIDASCSDITIEKSRTGSSYAVCGENNIYKFTVEVSDKTLTVKENEERKFADNIIMMSFGGPFCRLYLNESEYETVEAKLSSGSFECTEPEFTFNSASIVLSSGSIRFESPVSGELSAVSSSGVTKIGNCAPSAVKIKCLSGSVTLDNIKTEGKVEIEVTSGNVKVKDCESGTFVLEKSSGSARLENVTAVGKMELKSSSGSIVMRACDAAELNIRSSSGRVDCTLLSDKFFDVRSSSGNVDVPASVKDGGICTVRSSSGSVKIRIVDK